MGNFIKKAILFSILLIVGYCTLILLWGLYTPAFLHKNLIHKTGGKGHMYSRMQEVKSVRDVDIVFIGSSLCIRGFDPRIFEQHGYKTFNLGSGGQTPLQSLFLVKKYIHQLNPRLILFEVNPYIISRDGVESAIDLVSNHDFDWNFVKMALTINNIKVLNATIFSFWRTVLKLDKDFKEEPVKNEDTYIPGGFVERKISYFHPADFDKEPKYKMKPIEYQKEALEEFFDYIRSKKISLILVHPTVSETAYEAYQNDKYYVQSDNYFQEIGNYYNCNLYLTLNDSLHFYDSRHLNQDGVKIFNEALINDILNLDSLMKVLPPK